MRKSVVWVLILCLAVITTVTFVSCNSSDVLYENKPSYNYEVLYKLNEDGTGAVVTGVSKFNSQRLIIPAQADIEGVSYPVVGIDAKALENFDTLRMVELPETLKRIEDSVFFGCDELLEVKVPDGVEYIGKDVFMKCKKLYDVKLPSSLKQIGTKCFAECVSLKNVILPDSLKDLPEGVFYGCTNLESCDVGDGVVSINNYVFSGCKSLRNLRLGKNVATVGKGQLVVQNNGDMHLDIQSQNIIFGDNAFETGKAITVKTNHIANIAKLGIFQKFYAICEDENGYLVFVKDSGTVELIKGNYTGVLDLSSLNGSSSFVVNSIAKQAFENNTALEQVILPKGINHISQRAFASCTALEKVQLPSSLKIVDEMAFFNCHKLTFFSFGSGIETIGKDAFAGCNNVCFAVNKAYINIFGGDEVLNFRPYVLNCDNLAISDDGYVYGIEKNGYVTICDNIDKNIKDMVLPDQINGIKVAKLSENSFCSNISLSNLYVPDTVEAIGKNSFRNRFDLNVFLAHSTLPEKWDKNWINEVKAYYINTKKFVNDEDYLYHVGNDGFVSIAEYKGKERELVIQDSTEEGNIVAIKANAFENNGYITSVVLPSSLNRIEDYAFAGCISLKEVVNADSVTLQYIGDKAFYNCKELKYFYISDFVSYIGQSAFEYCSDTVVCYGAEQPYEGWHEEWAKGIQVRYNSHVTDNRFIYQVEEGKVKLLEYIGKDSEVQLPAEINGYMFAEIPEKLFADNRIIQKVTVPSSYLSIGESAFNGCANLKELIIGELTESIGANAFAGCNAIEKVECGANVLVHIPNYNLKSVTVVSGESVADGVLQNCKLLQNVVIKEGIKAIGNNCFKGSILLSSVDIPSSIEKIGKDAFADTAIFKEETNWEDNALYINGCLIAVKDKTIADFVFRDGTRLIGDYAFDGCAALESVIIPQGLQYIGEYAFAGCSAIKDIQLGTDVKFIGSYAFAGSAIKTIEIPISVERMCKNIFSNCKMDKIYAQATAQPEGWDPDWNSGNIPVVWDCENAVA